MKENRMAKPVEKTPNGAAKADGIKNDKKKPMKEVEDKKQKKDKEVKEAKDQKNDKKKKEETKKHDGQQTPGKDGKKGKDDKTKGDKKKGKEVKKDDKAKGDMKTEEAPKKDKESKKDGKKAGKVLVDRDDGVEEEDLKREIKLLGGTTDDIELLYEHTKESTVDEEEILGELKAFMGQLGMNPAKVNQGFVIDEDELEEEQEEEEAGEGENEDKDDDEDEDEDDEKDTADSKANGKLKEQLQQLIANPDMDVDELEDGGEKLDVATKAKKILIASETAWWELSNTEKSERKNRQTAIEEQTKRAEELLNRQMKSFETKRHISKSEAAWIDSVLKSGTLTDKVAALTLLVQENPMCRLHALENLVSMTKKKGKREFMAAIDSLKDLFLNDLLPERKLIYFTERPLEKKNSDQTILAWYFEDRLKTLYLDFITSLEALTHETLIFVKFKALTVIHDLLSGKSEQEKNLLALVVNKLGDTEKKLASKASFLLSQLLVKHPNMKMVVIKEVEQLLFRPNVSIKAQYYTTIFLNQTILTQKEGEVASKLVDVYFAVYQLLVSKGEVETKMLSALLTGINRAFPFANGVPTSKFDEHADLLFKVVHQSTFNTTVQALALLYQISTVKPAITNRYYRALYEILLDTRLLTTSKHTLFLNVLYKGLRDDPSLNRAKAFVKRILQICTYHQPHFVCGIFFMLAQVLRARPGLDSMMSQPEDKEEHFEDVKDEGDDEEEHFKDVKGEGSDEEEEEEEKTKGKETKPKRSSGVYEKVTSYDPKKRDPMYCGAELSCLWEIVPHLSHFHPSVASFAKSILKGEAITYVGNPLQDFTLIRFLDKFVYKNPKKEIKAKGFSIMQPSQSLRAKDVPMNVKNFGKLSNNVEIDEVFFQKFFSEKKKRLQGKPTKGEKEDEDPFAMEEDIDDDYGEAEDVDELSGDDDADEAEEKLKEKKSKKSKKVAPDEDDGSDDDDEIYKTLGDASDDEDDEELNEADFEDEKKLEKLLLKDITDENFGDEDFDDEGDDDEAELDAEDDDVDDDDDDDDNGEDDEDEDDEDGLMFGDDDDEDFDDDDDDDGDLPFGDDSEDDGSDEDDEDDEDDKGKAGSKKRKRDEDKIKFGGSTFASAEEFSHLLEGTGKSKNAGKQDAWDERVSNFEHRDKRRNMGGGGSRGGSRGGARGGFKGSRGGKGPHGKRGGGGGFGGRGGSRGKARGGSGGRGGRGGRR